MSYDFADKWSPAIKRKGYTQVPNLLIKHQADLGITSTEMVVIIGLLMHRRTKKNPYPSLNTIGSYGGKSRNTAQGAARSLEHKGLIRRIFRGGNKTNEYDIAPLVKRLESFTQPIENSIPTYQKPDSRRYQETDTKEEAVNNKQVVRPAGNSGKPAAIGDVLHSKGWP